MRPLLALFLLSPATVASQSARDQIPARDTSRLAITGVTVIDVTRGQSVRDQTVVIHGTRIAAVGPTGRTPAPPDARAVDGRDKFLIPGLWDMHVHALLRRPEAAPLYLANGITGVRQMGTDAPPETVAVHRARLRAGRIVASPRFITAGPILAGRDQFPQRPRVTVLVRTPGDARRAVDSLARAGFDLIKVHNYLSREAFFAIAREARSRGVPFAGHLPHVVRVAEGSDSGMRSMEHLRGLEGACSADEHAYLSAQRAAHAAGAPDRDTSRVTRSAYAQAVDSYIPARCRAAGTVLARNGTWVTPTLIAGTRFRVSRDSLLTDSRLRYVPAEVAEAWRQALTEVWTDSGWVRWQRVRPRIVPELQRAGVGVLAGTDAGAPGPNNVFFGFSVHDELALFVRAGLTPLEALRTATLNPARYLRATDSLGTIAPGMLADLVLLDADPLADIRNTTRIRAVVANGRFFDRTALDTLLATAERAARPRKAPQSSTGPRSQTTRDVILHFGRPVRWWWSDRDPAAVLFSCSDRDTDRQPPRITNGC